MWKEKNNTNCILCSNEILAFKFSIKVDKHLVFLDSSFLHLTKIWQSKWPMLGLINGLMIHMRWDPSLLLFCTFFSALSRLLWLSLPSNDCIYHHSPDSKQCFLKTPIQSLKYLRIFHYASVTVAFSEIFIITTRQDLSTSRFIISFFPTEMSLQMIASPTKPPQNIFYFFSSIKSISCSRFG